MYDEFNKILEKARAGDVAAVESLLDRVRPLIIAQIRRYYNKREDYEDLISQGNLVVLECLRTFDPDKGVKFLGYIKCQLMYLYLDKHKVKIHQSLNSPISGETGGEKIDLLLSESQGPLDEYLDLEKNQSLARALAILTPRQRQVIIMFYMENSSIPQIAESLGLAYRTIVNTKTYALNKMRGYLESEK